MDTRKMSEGDAVPLDAVPIVDPAELSRIAAAQPAPEVKAVRPKRTYNRKPKEPKEPKPEVAAPAKPEPAAPKHTDQLDPQFFAGLNCTLKRMMELERRAKLGSLRIV